MYYLSLCGIKEIVEIQKVLAHYELYLFNINRIDILEEALPGFEPTTFLR